MASVTAYKNHLAQRLSTVINLFVAGGDRTRSILPFIPRPIRWLFFLLVLTNYRAFPIVWHYRVFSDIALIRLRGFLKWFSHVKRRQFVKELSPIGESPFEIAIAYKTTVGLSDCDYNGHLSNSAYAKNLDYARMRAAVICFPSVLEAKGWLGLGAAHFHFIKEIPLFSEYEIRINIAGWEEKWLYLVVQFVTYPKKQKKEQKTIAATVQLSHAESAAVTSAGGDTSQQSEPSNVSSIDSVPSFEADESQPDIDLDDGLASPRLRPRSLSSTSSTSSYMTTQDEADFEDSPASETSTPASSIAPDSPPSGSPSKPLLNLPSSSSQRSSPQNAPYNPESPVDLKSTAMPALPEGAVVHCIHVSSYCFKIGRITIPPRVALVVSGFGDPDKGRWDRVQEIRNTRVADASSGEQEATRKGRGGLRSILRGGWRKYDAEGLWDLPEYEQMRKKGVDAFGTLRTQMDGLKG